MKERNTGAAGLIVDLDEFKIVGWKLSTVKKIVEIVGEDFFEIVRIEDADRAKTPLIVIVDVVNQKKIPEEGFDLVCSAEGVRLSMSSLSGLFYGLVEIAKPQRKNLKVSFRPLQIERSLMIDIGRKFYSQEWLFQLVDLMASLKMNTLQLHFSENEGFRIESSTFPEIVSEEYLTKKEVKALIAYAKERFIQVIPELDSPGHLKRLLSFYPDWCLERVGEYNPYLDHRALDVTNPEAVAGIRELLKEYFELFKDSKYFHIGADEFVEFDKLVNYPTLQQKAKEKYGQEATGIELYIDYTNDLIDFVHQHGFQARVWNDGFYRLDQPNLVELTKEVQITYWTKWHSKMASVEEYLTRGYQVVNFNDNFFYFVLGEAAGYTYPTEEKIVAEWTPANFAQQQVLKSEELEAIIGSSFAIWSDLPEALTATEVYQKITGPLRGLAVKSWENKQIISK